MSNHLSLSNALPAKYNGYFQHSHNNAATCYLPSYYNDHYDYHDYHDHSRLHCFNMPCHVSISNFLQRNNKRFRFNHLSYDVQRINIYLKCLPHIL